MPGLPPDHYAVHVDGRAVAFEKDPETGLIEARGASLRGPSDFFGVECAGPSDDVAQTALRRFTDYGRWRPLNDELATVPTDAGVRIFYLHTPTTFGWDVETELRRTSALRTETSPNGYRPPLAFETWAFACAHPELSEFMAPGVTIEDAEGTFYPQVIRLSPSGRLMNSGFGSGPQPSPFRLLLVRR